jgi:transcriptional regulator with XRE-family HTH domain
MTPFGQKIRELRAERSVSLKVMAEHIGVSAAYLSALEHGHRGAPAWYLVQRIISYFNVIWDEAEELEKLAQLSNPRVVLDTSGLRADTTLMANNLAKNIKILTSDDVKAIDTIIKSRLHAGKLV